MSRHQNWAIWRPARKLTSLRKHGVIFVLATALVTNPSAYAIEPASLGEAQAAYTFLHKNPELGKDLLKAHYYILSRLKAMGGSSFETVPLLPSAVIAVLDSGRPGPVIALRADMDARRLDLGDEPSDHDPSPTYQA